MGILKKLKCFRKKEKQCKEKIEVCRTILGKQICVFDVVSADYADEGIPESRYIGIGQFKQPECKDKLEVRRTILGRQVCELSLVSAYYINEDIPQPRYTEIEKFKKPVSEGQVTPTENDDCRGLYVPEAMIQAALAARHAVHREEIESDEGNCSKSNSSGSSENVSNNINQVHSDGSDYESIQESSHEYISFITEDTHL